MKKFFALTLAVAMVLSLASVAMAAVEIEPADVTADTAVWVLDNALYTYSSTTKKLTAYDDGDTDAKIPYGKTVYMVLTSTKNPTLQQGSNVLLTEKESGDRLKVQAEWTEGASNVKGVEIVKKKVKDFGVYQKFADFEGSIYMVAINTTGSSTADTEVAGEIKVSGRSGEGRAKADFEVGVEFTLGYNPGTVGATKIDDVDDTMKVYNIEAKIDDNTIDEADAEEYTINMGDVEVVANVKTEKKVILSADTDVIDDIDDAYPDANLDYYALTGNFRKTAEVYLTADEDTYLYEVVDGKVVAMDAEYDEWEGAFVFKAKKLGTYVVSDTKLDTTAAVETAPANPSTGAAA